MTSEKKESSPKFLLLAYNALSRTIRIYQAELILTNVVDYDEFPSDSRLSDSEIRQMLQRKFGGNWEIDSEHYEMWRRRKEDE